MIDALNAKETLGTTVHAITGKWGWFVALGISELILGGVASTNLMAANLASVLVIGAVMVVAGIFQIIYAFAARGLRAFLFWQLADRFVDVRPLALVVYGVLRTAQAVTPFLTAQA